MKLLRKIMGGISLTAAMFVFQACYGTMDDYYDYSSMVTFRVVSAETGAPLPSIRIEARQITPESGSDGDSTWTNHEYTDSNGLATLWATRDRAHHFYLIDDSSNYATADTILFPIEVDTVDIRMRTI